MRVNEHATQRRMTVVRKAVGDLFLASKTVDNRTTATFSRLIVHFYNGIMDSGI